MQARVMYLMCKDAHVASNLFQKAKGRTLLPMVHVLLISPAGELIRTLRLGSGYVCIGHVHSKGYSHACCAG